MRKGILMMLLVLALAVPASAMDFTAPEVPQAAVPSSRQSVRAMRISRLNMGSPLFFGFLYFNGRFPLAQAPQGDVFYGFSQSFAPPLQSDAGNGMIMLSCDPKEQP